MEENLEPRFAISSLGFATQEVRKDRGFTVVKIPGFNWFQLIALCKDVLFTVTDEDHDVWKTGKRRFGRRM